MPTYPRPPYIFVCDRCGHTVTLWGSQVSVRPRPCIQPGCTGVLWRVRTEREETRKADNGQAAR